MLQPSIEGLRYGIDGPGIECRHGQDIFPLLQTVQTDPEAHPVSYSKRSGVLSRGGEYVSWP